MIFEYDITQRDSARAVACLHILQAAGLGEDRNNQETLGRRPSRDERVARCDRLRTQGAGSSAGLGGTPPRRNM
jgi:hypothetical protein